jgi:phosphoribosylaminoimidazole-succinocarboxamide synthase
MLASDLPLPRIGRGKVRDIYAVGDDRVLLPPPTASARSTS